LVVFPFVFVICGWLAVPLSLWILWRMIRNPRDLKYLLTRSGPDCPKPDVLSDPEWTHTSVKANGVLFHCVTTAKKPKGKPKLMLFLHGFPECWYSWRHQMRDFCEEYKVVAVDLRGYGETEKPRGLTMYGMDYLVTDVRELIKALGYQNCILVGHDWGAQICWNFAMQYGDMIEKLVIINVPHPVSFVKNISFRQLTKSWYILLFQIPFMPEFVLQANNYGLFDGMFSKKDKESGKRVYFATKEQVSAFKYSFSRPYALTASLNYYRNLFLDMVKPVPSFKKKPIAVPTIVIWGEDDVALGKELNNGTEKFVTNLKIKFIPNCTHWANQDQPEIVNGHMRDFL